MSSKSTGGFLIPTITEHRVRRWKYIPFFHKTIEVNFRDELIKLIKADRISWRA